MHGHTIASHGCGVLNASPQLLVSADLVAQLIHQLESCSMCPGNPDEKFLTLASTKKGVFLSHYGMYI